MPSPPTERPFVRGAVVDDMTRCVHHRTAVDIVAIRFACCGEYYPCHLCHAETSGHAARQWRTDQHHVLAILCGACGVELTIAEYRRNSACPSCSAPFNERCAQHEHLYFDVS